jgi:hypothetical protein
MRKSLRKATRSCGKPEAAKHSGAEKISLDASKTPMNTDDSDDSAGYITPRDEQIRARSENLRHNLNNLRRTQRGRKIVRAFLEKLGKAKTKKKVEDILQHAPISRANFPSAKYVKSVIGESKHKTGLTVGFLADSFAGEGFNITARRSRDICADERKREHWIKPCRKCGYTGPASSHFCRKRIAALTPSQPRRDWAI